MKVHGANLQISAFKLWFIDMCHSVVEYFAKMKHLGFFVCKVIDVTGISLVNMFTRGAAGFHKQVKLFALCKV